jgi:hypothetical protein
MEPKFSVGRAITTKNPFPARICMGRFFPTETLPPGTYFIFGTRRDARLRGRAGESDGRSYRLVALDDNGDPFPVSVWESDLIAATGWSFEGPSNVIPASDGPAGTGSPARSRG